MKTLSRIGFGQSNDVAEIAECTLTDGSKVYDLVLVDGEHTVTLGAVNYESAYVMRECILHHCAHITIRPNNR
jgi:hypothetical protein